MTDILEGWKDGEAERLSLADGFTPLLLAALAKMELATLAERRAAGIKRAQAEGKHCGRPTKGDPDIVKSMFERGLTWQQIAEATGLSKASIYRLRAM
ncbi:recombinase family protein [Salmonella enterica]